MPRGLKFYLLTGSLGLGQGKGPQAASLSHHGCPRWQINSGAWSFRRHDGIYVTLVPHPESYNQCPLRTRAAKARPLPVSSCADLPPLAPRSRTDSEPLVLQFESHVVRHRHFGQLKPLGYFKNINYFRPGLFLPVSEYYLT